MRKISTLANLIFGLSLAMTACGNADATINVTLSDYAYTPNTFTVPPGVTVTINAKNTGSVYHEFIILKKGMTLTPPCTGDTVSPKLIFDMGPIESGTTETVTFTSPSEPGTYEVLSCPDLQKGMVASFIVK